MILASGFSRSLFHVFWYKLDFGRWLNLQCYCLGLSACTFPQCKPFNKTFSGILPSTFWVLIQWCFFFLPFFFFFDLVVCLGSKTYTLIPYSVFHGETEETIIVTQELCALHSSDEINVLRFWKPQQIFLLDL